MTIVNAKNKTPELNFNCYRFNTKIFLVNPDFSMLFFQLAGLVEYVNCISAEG